MLMKKRVERGAAWLDKERPGWADQINAEVLIMERCDRCVLAEVFGNYSTGVFKLHKSCPNEEEEISHNHGFTRLDDDVYRLGTEDAAWQALKECWIDEIAKRQ